MDFVLSGHIIHTPASGELVIVENGYLACENGRVAGVFERLPEKYAHYPRYEHKDCLVIPGLCDVHLHAPQYAFRGTGMDLQLLSWLNEVAFPQELKYAGLEYANLAYGIFANDLARGFTTRAAIFATMHAPATLRLMELLEKTGLRCLVGKVSMDRSAPVGLLDAPGEAALDATAKWIEQSLSRFERTRPIVTPRFAPSCSDKALAMLGRLRREYGLPVQSHLSENTDEVALVRRLWPKAACYADVYRQYGLLDGKDVVMAHCVHPTDVEMAMLEQSGTMVAHCPASNANLASGIAPIRRYLDAGVPVGLGSDIAGGHDASILRAMADAVQVSKLRNHFTQRAEKSVTLAEAFHMGTKGGGALFGKVGSFEEGYELDALVLDDSALAGPEPLTVRQRLERAIYLDKQLILRRKLVRGINIALTNGKEGA